uniref:(California timema) hypothetical protein n=1 Tax=Timema californicum TaxID=61474 RepID=A0A7R9JHN6_TIMCA|nr:unnamed protein product [Timema californicum]
MLSTQSEETDCKVSRMACRVDNRQAGCRPLVLQTSTMRVTLVAYILFISRSHIVVGQSSSVRVPVLVHEPFELGGVCVARPDVLGLQVFQLAVDIVAVAHFVSPATGKTLLAGCEIISRANRLGGSRIWTVCTSGGSISTDYMTADLAGSDDGAVSLSITSTDHTMWIKLLKVKPIFLILRCHLSRFDKMTVVNLEFPSTLSKSDPQKQPVIIIGQLKNLMKAKYSSVKAKLEPHVTEQVYSSAIIVAHQLVSLSQVNSRAIIVAHQLVSLSQVYSRAIIVAHQLVSLSQVYSSAIIVAHQLVSLSQVYSAALASLHPSPTDSCSLYLNLATVAALPVKCSRHNTPSRAHFITKLVKSATVGVDESVVIVCRREDVFASACAVARAYPLYSRKTTNNLSASTKTATVQVHFVLLASSDDAGSMAVNNGTAEGELGLGEADVELLKNATMAVRLAARIVDTPCNEMNVDTFVQEVLTVGQALGVKSTVIRGEELNERGFGGIYGVGKAALVPPALVVLSYLPQGATETIAWVGKGIVYDTGGLSIKGKVTTTQTTH